MSAVSRKGSNAERGVRGEEAAARWYRRRGYVILAQRWRCRVGEIDLVVARGDTLVFCEVKARSSRRYGWAGEAVDSRKQAKVRMLASVWLSCWDRPAPSKLRFDVAAVEGSRVRVLIAAW
jgi:putative endonuclease